MWVVLMFRKGNAPWNKGKTGIYSEEYQKKISESRKGEKHWCYGKHLSEETRHKISESKKGSKNPMYHRIFSEQQKKNMSDAHKGLKRSEETCQKLSKALKGRIFTEEHKRNLSGTWFKKGFTPWNKGKEGIKKKPLTEEHKRKLSKAHKGFRHTEESRRKMSISHKGKKMGISNPNWRGGLSVTHYGTEFNTLLKEQIRQRDNYRCRQCFRQQSELFIKTKTGIKPLKLIVHHIDYNKKNNSPKNLISLCPNCHSQTNFKREDWSDYFQERLKEDGVLGDKL